jgi:signal transduction histidine kinase
VTSLLRIAGAGLVVALAVGAAGALLERRRFGASDEAALARVRAEVSSRIDATAERLGVVAARVADTGASISPAQRDPALLRSLFDRAAEAIRDQDAGRTGITLFDTDGVALAWAGRVFDPPKERLSGPSAFFVAPGTLGPRLVRVEPLLLSFGRAGTVVAEQSIGSLQGAPGSRDTFILETALVPVEVRVRLGDAPGRGPYTFVVPSRSGGLVVEAEISPADLVAARAAWRRLQWSAVTVVIGLTLVLCAGPLLDVRGRRTRNREFLIDTIVLTSFILAGLALLAFAASAYTDVDAADSPTALLLIAIGVLALVVLTIETIAHLRVTWRRPVLSESIAPRITATYLIAGGVAALVLAAYDVVLRRLVASTSLDVLHFSLHPLNGQRIAVTFSLVLLHASAIWAGAAIVASAALLARPRARSGAVLWSFVGGAIGAVAVTFLLSRVRPQLPFTPLLAALAASGACAATLARFSSRLRRASQATRLFALFVALLAPAVAMYPSLFAFAISAKERLIADTYGPQALSQREDLQRRLNRAIEQIDQLALSDFASASDQTPTTDRAFVVWSRTDLQRYRLTSSVELFGEDGSPLSRFSLKLPEYGAGGRARAVSCTWEAPFDEASPIGANDRHVLRTAKGICDQGRIVGTIVVRAMLDYRALPFISSASPYLEAVRPSEALPDEAVSGRDVELARYSWSRAPIVETGSRVWTLTDAVFQRLSASREPFWALMERDGTPYRVHFSSDRGEIYALGYPVITWTGQLINLAELVLLVLVLYTVLLAAVTLFSALTSRVPATGRALLREIRASFYRKLFLAYVAGTVLPIVVLAFAIRTYFAQQLRESETDIARRTVTTAQRLVEDYAAIQQAGPTALSTIDDQIMFLVGRAIDEDVHLFERSRLQATSARDLFASLLLSTRTPGEVYRSVILDRAPTFVSDEAVGDASYRIAAAPVRAAGREGVVTVPLANRLQQIDEQIDELDRRVRSAAVLFSLLGAALGFWIAERIADPVNRLTRATRRIAHGDLDAHIARASSDELGRLVEDFNHMAMDLKRQRAELERTQRLEAWADMARQVAHDIKNPLTPIQLSAEHAQRVNQDRGCPLSPVLDDCVNSILSQVRLLRQISAEFSSFASSPTPRPETTEVRALVEEVVAPYRTGLATRIAIDVASETPLIRARIDRTLFARALTNVIENALHAMPGQGKLAISLDGIDARTMAVAVTDTGVGMDADALKRIFEPYFSTKATGTGLGLTIAKRNTELNGGAITVTSERGKGTTVTMTLPVM